MVQRFLYPFFNFVMGNLFDLQGERHVIKDVHVGPDRKSLEHHAQSPPFRRNVEILFFDGNRLAAEVDLTFRQVFETGDHAQGRGLAAAGGA